ncbi:Sterol regulatory element-binding protein ECM22 [Ilyonectria robusta]
MATDYYYDDLSPPSHQQSASSNPAAQSTSQPEQHQSPPTHPDDSAADAPDAAPADRPYHSKRPHKKSRAGCRNCKARKVKCDEVRPTCRSCRLRKVECVYPTPAASFPASSSTSATVLPSPAPSTADHCFVRGNSPDGISSPSSVAVSQRQGSPTVVAQPLWCPSNIDAADMKLLWFYTASTSQSFSVSTGVQDPVAEILKVRMVQVAFETPFLMDSLFALSSLHMQSLNQELDPSRALAYRARSFEGYRRAVEAAAPESYAALIANSLFLTALSSQVFREEDGKDLYIIDWMIVWRGIGLVIELMGIENLFQTGMYALFNRPPIDLLRASSSIPNHLLFMVSSIKPDELDYPDIKTYHETLKYVGSLYGSLEDGITPVMCLRIITWFTFLPRRFIELARQRRPRALVIIAYYAAFLKIVKSVWWLEGVGHRSLLDICKYLGPEWEHLLVIPQAAMQVDDELGLVRVIFQDPNWVPPQPTNLRLDPTASITMVDDAGRRVAWTPGERKIVVLDSAKPAEPVVWNA